MDEKKIIILEHDSEADTCRKEVTPKLYAGEWTDEQILEQCVFIDGTTTSCEIYFSTYQSWAKSEKYADQIRRELGDGVIFLGKKCQYITQRIKKP